ncbi:hypothetical protein quinque_003763 [Culex quinquefasciatus]
MKSIFLLAAVLAFASYSHAAKVQLAAAVNGDKSFTYTVGTNKLIVSKTVADLLPTISNTVTALLASSAVPAGIKLQVTLNDDGSLVVGAGDAAITLPASVVNQVRSILVFVYKTISTLAQQKNIVGFQAAKTTQLPIKTIDNQAEGVITVLIDGSSITFPASFVTYAQTVLDWVTAFQTGPIPYISVDTSIDATLKATDKSLTLSALGSQPECSGLIVGPNSLNSGSRPQSVLAFASYSHAAKVKLAAAVNGDKSFTYTVGTNKLIVSKTVADLLPTISNTVTALLASSAVPAGIKLQVTLNDDGSLVVGAGDAAITLPASVVNQVRSILVFVYKTISTLAQQKNIVGLY